MESVAVAVERGYITDLDIDIVWPVKVEPTKGKSAEPVTTSVDIATDGLMKSPDDLGLRVRRKLEGYLSVFS